MIEKKTRTYSVTHNECNRFSNFLNYYGKIDLTVPGALDYNVCKKVVEVNAPGCHVLLDAPPLLPRVNDFANEFADDLAGLDLFARKQAFAAAI